MASLKIRLTCALLLALTAAGCGTAEPPSPPEADPAPAVTEVAATLTAKAPLEPPAAPRPAAPPPPAPAAASSPLCDELCTRTASLKCGPAEDCRAGCNEMAESEVCSKELRAMLECISAQPVKSFECDPETKAPAIREGLCDTEQGAVAQCVASLGAPAEVPE